MNEQLTREEATTALTLIDIGVKAAGVKILEWPGGFAALETLCRKLEAAQKQESK